MSIGENIKQIRERNGLTQKELGDILGVSDKAVSTWERGEKIPRMGTIQKIANYFNTAAGTLIGEEGARHGVHSDTVYTLTTREIPLVESPDSGSDFFSSAEKTVSIPETVKADIAYIYKNGVTANKKLRHGDIIYIDSTAKIENGATSAFVIEGFVEIRRVYICPDMFLLISEDTDAAPLYFRKEAFYKIEFLGRVVAYLCRAD